MPINERSASMTTSLPFASVITARTPSPWWATLLQFGTGHNRNPTLAQSFGQLSADFFVFVGDDPGQRFDQGHLAPKGTKH
jgi:hypothetical protein